MNGRGWSPREVTSRPAVQRPAEVALIWWATAVGGVVLGGWFLAISARSLDNGFVSDDWAFLQRWMSGRGFGTVVESLAFNTEWFVRPTQLAITGLLFRIAGSGPAAYHFASVTLDLVNAALVSLLAFRLLKVDGSSTEGHAATSAVVGVFFLFTWRHHEAVFWYSAINELLSAFFRLLGLLLVAGALPEPGRRVGLLIAGVGAFVLALLSKESAVAMPAEVLLLCLLNRSAQRGRRAGMVDCARILCPFIVLAGAWVYIYLRTAGAGAGFLVQRGGLTVLRASPWEIVGRFLQFFNGHFLGSAAVSRRSDLLALEFVLLLVLAALAIARRRYLWLFAVAWTFVCVAPYAALVSIESLRAGTRVMDLGVTGDRFLYYSAAGASLTVVSTFRWIVEEMEASRRRAVYARIIHAAVGLSLVGYLGLCVRRVAACEREWDHAGRVAGSVVRGVQSAVPSPAADSVLCVVDVPDSVNGKYVFREGLPDALYVTYARHDFTVKVKVLGGSNARDSVSTGSSGCSLVLRFQPGTGKVVSE